MSVNALTSAESKKGKILIITSAGALGEEIVRALDTEGFGSVLVRNGTEGLKAIYDVLPHLIILDTVLPEGDSYDIVSKKQSEPMLAKIPVFMMSSQGLPMNMRLVPNGSVESFIISSHSSPKEIARRVAKRLETAMS